MRRLAIALVALIGFAQPSMAKDDCGAEVDRLTPLASGLSIDVAAAADVRVGDAIHVTWSLKERLPEAVPVYAVMAVPGEARFEIEIASRENDDQTEAAAAERPIEKGRLSFLALTPEATAPYGLKAGAGQTRVLFPLHSRDGALTGSFVMRMFTAGDHSITTFVVAATQCGERTLGTTDRKAMAVRPAPPEVVIQNPYDTEAPLRAMASKDGRYMVQVFKGRYRVFETATGAKLLDRPGHAPNFSPTSRFIAADIGDADGQDFEVVDLVSRAVVARPMGPFVGWLYGDSVLLDGPFQYGLGVRQSLVARSGVGQLWNRFVLDHTEMDRTDSHDDHLWSYIGSECHGCASWNSRVRIDLEGRCDAILVAKSSETCPLSDHIHGWKATEPLVFSHVIDSRQVEQRYARNSDRDSKALFAQLQALRAGLAPSREISIATIPRQLAVVSDGTKVRGDWIGATRRDAGADITGLGGSVTKELEAFGLQLATVTKKEVLAFAPRTDSDGLFLGITAQYGTTEKDAARLASKLVSEIPALKKQLSKPDGPNRSSFDRAPIEIESSILGLWRWLVGGRPVYLLQTLTIEGSGAFGNGAIWLLDGRGETSVRSLNAESFWDGNYESTAEQTRLRVQVIAERYLVAASAVDKTLAVYDLATMKMVGVLENVPHADLVQDFAMSRDGRLVVQINSDGQFFIHDLPARRLLVLGRYIDGETVLYTKEGYYWSSYEGAHFVNLRFPGIAGQHSFQQFASILKRKDIVEAELQGTGTAPPPNLTPPPTAEMDVGGNATSAAGNQIHVRVRASSPIGVRSLRFFQDGQLIRDVAVNAKELQSDIALDIAPHARWLTILAVDTRGLVSTPQSLHVRPRANGTNQLHAVLVGVDTYPDRRNNLAYARSDARRLAAALTARRGRYYASEQVTLLLDQDAKPDAIVAALERVVGAAQPQDTILFSFAGHGLKGSDGHYYLTPSGFRVEETAKTGLAWSRLAEIFSRSKARIIVLLDACHAGLSGVEGLASNDQAAAALLSGARAPMLVLAASKGRESSLESSDWGGGVFTYALSQVLKAQTPLSDQKKDSTINVSDLYRALREIVWRKTGGKQTPWLARQDLIGDFAVF